jgi:5-methylcytosine-specific restriction endonuclease McrA
MERIILLNADYTFLNFLDWKRAIKLMVKGKVEIIEDSTKKIRAFTNVFIVPKVLKLVKLIRTLYKIKTAFSKKHIFMRDDDTCQYCGSKDTLTIDHVIPISRGGKSCFDNCVVACKKCNNLKNNRLPSEAGLLLRRKPRQPTINEFTLIKLRNHGFEDMISKIVKI